MRFVRGEGTRDATRRNSSSPVKSNCAVLSGSGRFTRQAMRSSSARDKTFQRQRTARPVTAWPLQSLPVVRVKVRVQRRQKTVRERAA